MNPCRKYEQEIIDALGEYHHDPLMVDDLVGVVKDAVEEAVKPYLAVVEAAKVLETDIKQDECCDGEGCYDVGYLKDLRKALAALPQEPR